MRFGKTRLFFIENQNSLDLIRRGNITNYYKVPRFNKVSIHVNFSNALKDLKSLGVLYNIIFSYVNFYTKFNNEFYIFIYFFAIYNYSLLHKKENNG